MATPVRSSGAERLRPRPGDLLVALAILLSALVLAWALRPAGGGEALSVRLTLDGETLAQYDLTALDGPTRVTVDQVSWPMVLELSPDGVQVVESRCPGQDCVHTGAIHTAGAQIVCLPNRLIIALEGSAPEPTPEFDVIAG